MSPTIDLVEKKFVLPSPLQSLHYHRLPKSILIKRDDLIHPLVSGNKWRKLKYSVEESFDKKSKQWVSFGGPFSNHLCALSTVASYVEMPLKVFVRGEKHLDQNPTVSRMLKQGTQVEYIPRHEFRAFCQNYAANADEFVFPEGGSNVNALRGINEMIKEIKSQTDLSNVGSIWVSVGTGGTLAGILKAVPANLKVYGVSAVNDPSIKSRIEQWIGTGHNFDVIMPTKRFGYGRLTQEKIDFFRDLYYQTKVKIDPIYTARLFWQILQAFKVKQTLKEEQILIIHTGGLQGLVGYEYIHDHKIYQSEITNT